jgi:hypothetical protein
MRRSHDVRLAGISNPGDVEKIIRSQRAIRRRLDMITGNKKLLLTVGRRENGRLRVVGRRL